MVQAELTIGRVTVLFGSDGGRYPDGNSLPVRGATETALIDPSLSIASADQAPSDVGRILISHCHEDHVAGVYRYPGVPIHVHADDLPGLRSLDGMMAIYGWPDSVEAAWRK